MQIKSAGASPTISHRISHSRLATAPKAFVSSLEILPNVILGCDLIEEAHRDSMTITVPAVIGCPAPASASMGLSGSADKQNSAANTFSSHHNKTMPEITQSIPRWGEGRWGRPASALTGRAASSNMNWLPDEVHFQAGRYQIRVRGRGFKQSPDRAWGWHQFILPSRLNNTNRQV